MDSSSSPNVESSNSDTSSINTAGAGAGAATATSVGSTLNRYENQKRRDSNTFGEYLKNHRPSLSLSRCSGAHVLKFLCYLDQFGKTKVHSPVCPFYSHPKMMP